MNKSVSISELRQQIAQITDEVSLKGATFVLVKNGKPVAKISPVDTNPELSPEFAKLVNEVFAEYKSDLSRLAD
jgi:prevent-host-death family protein